VSSEGRVDIAGSLFKRPFEWVYPRSLPEIKRFFCSALSKPSHTAGIYVPHEPDSRLVFRLKPISQDSAPSAGKPSPGQISWNYDRAEIVLDGVVHAVGIMLGLTGAVALVVIAARSWPATIAPTVIYVVALVAMLGISAAYNMWPVSPTKWLLRRFDHSAIYLLIAGTYTPFLSLMKSGLASVGLAIGIWSSALVGMSLKLALPGRFDRLSVALYLLLGWIGIIAYDHVAAVVPSVSLWLLAIGGVLYSLGTLFHVWERLRFQNAIWHGFVLLAAGCHYAAVLACLPWL
jgi:hemolysin III